MYSRRSLPIRLNISLDVILAHNKAVTSPLFRFCGSSEWVWNKRKKTWFAVVQPCTVQALAPARGATAARKKRPIRGRNTARSTQSTVGSACPRSWCTVRSFFYAICFSRFFFLYTPLPRSLQLYLVQLTPLNDQNASYATSFQHSYRGVQSPGRGPSGMVRFLHMVGGCGWSLR